MTGREGPALRVGVLGGMGPAATADFYAKLVAATPAARDQDHLPVVIWADPRIPDRTSAVLGEGPDPSPWLADGARELASVGADLIAIPCNTAHAFLDAVRAAVAPVTVLDMVGETAARVRALLPGARVGVLATTGTVAAGLYQDALGRRGLTAVIPKAAAQAAVMAAINDVKAGDAATARDRIAPAVAELTAAGCDLAIAACTEIPLMFAVRDASPLPVVDATDVLAHAVLHHARPTLAGTAGQSG